jgi:protein-disulfide isomerase
VKNQVQTDSDLALRGGVNSTPTFFIDGVKLIGYNSFDDFKQILIDRSASVTTP